MMKTEIVKVNILGSLMTPCGKTLALWDESSMGTANWWRSDGFRMFHYPSDLGGKEPIGTLAVRYSIDLGVWIVTDILEFYRGDNLFSRTANQFVQGHVTAGATDAFDFLRKDDQRRFTSGTIHTERLTVVPSRKKTLIDILAEFRNQNEPMAILSKTFEIIGG